ncbi:MAG: glucose-1-phosphate thymidylyltransferase [Candidatus Pelagibacter sp. TMED64]|mgnify:FL=1|nr:glucose-1-phosphate thymidylyltransferase [Candidatus Pelagibacter sp.]OUU66218.1 MAG: glucose-1-phosphate thymidylyltransferase [Candidatus Pelagibacter sp. TMED64]|tara:strand:- start:468 stop:1334 length:867 start_codon:yes stop_codon:yes gene_type:complete
MINKGIILAGGMGTRLSPLTKVINKQLLPLYDKPLIFYPLSVLMLSGIKNILIITNPNENNIYKKILGDGTRFGIKISYKEQAKPNGLPEAFILGKKFIGKDGVALILGDNFFYGEGFTKRLKNGLKKNKGATIFAYAVNNASNYGVVKVNNNNKVLNIVEKPKKYISNLAITGLYYFNNKVIRFAEKLKPSKRKELEITDLIKKYKRDKQLKVELIGRGGSWLDAGTIKDLFDASTFVSTVEKRQGFKIACLEEIALRNKWITKNLIIKSIKFYGNCDYSNYLKKLI